VTQFSLLRIIFAALADLSVLTTKTDEPSPEPGSLFFQLQGKNAEYRFYTTDPDQFDWWVSSLARRLAKRKATASLAVTFDQLVAKMKDEVCKALKGGLVQI
jgi:hypothetical protein